MIEAKKRRTRSDKGEIRATQRDIACVTWIAEQYAARGDQLQQLITRYPDSRHPYASKLASPSTTREQIGRWVRAGWIVYKRVLANGPGWAYVTKAGLQMVDLDGEFTARPPSVKRLNHIFAVNQIRLWYDEEGYAWRSERRLRAGLTLKRGESSGPIPDALTWEEGKRVAVEVQISALKPNDWLAKMRELLQCRQTKRDEYGYELRYPSVWFYVPTEEMEKAAEKASTSLKDAERERVSVVLEDDLLMDEKVWL